MQINKYTKGGSHSVACFATSPAAFKMAVDITRRKGTVVAVGLPQGTVGSSPFEPFESRSIRNIASNPPIYHPLIRRGLPLLYLRHRAEAHHHQGVHCRHPPRHGGSHRLRIQRYYGSRFCTAPTLYCHIASPCSLR